MAFPVFSPLFKCLFLMVLKVGLLVPFLGTNFSAISWYDEDNSCKVSRSLLTTLQGTKAITDRPLVWWTLDSEAA